MKYLSVTLIDVGWGDSILVEASDVDAGGQRPRFMLVDSNDNAEKDYWPSWNFLRKHFGLREDQFIVIKPFFDAVILSHDHSDHGSGLKRIMQKYGTGNFWYPKVNREESVVLTSLQAYVDHPSVRIDNEALDNAKNPGNLGDVAMKVLWPPPNTIDSNPNNNSIVIALELDGVTFLLTGDAEGEVWDQISNQIPPSTQVFKVPHHGSRNGTIYHNHTPWVDRVSGFPIAPYLGISCHPNFPNRFDFPHQDVLVIFQQNPFHYYRTDMDYHLTFIKREGQQVTIRYSHEL
jgi:beta-lactamase superfamily II metal-dependent hydrolase